MAVYAVSFVSLKGKPMESTEKVLAEIREERDYQDDEWGQEFDDNNTLNDWAAYIGHYKARATSMGSSPNIQRKSMMKVAALAVAACEAFDRNGQFPPRHYKDRVATR